MRYLAAILVLAFFVGFSGAAVSVEPDEVLSDPVLEARARALSAELRCMVCQNQSIDDSDAPLARDLRILVRERLTAGDSNSDVVDFLVARYGEFVLLKPRFNRNTALLWIVPPATLVISAIAAIVFFRRRRTVGEAKPLDEAEKRRLATIVGTDQ